MDAKTMLDVRGFQGKLAEVRDRHHNSDAHHPFPHKTPSFGFLVDCFPLKIFFMCL